MSRTTTTRATICAAVLLVGATSCADDDDATTDDVTTTIGEITTTIAPATSTTTIAPTTTATTIAPTIAPTTIAPATTGGQLPADFPAGRIVFRRFDESQSQAALHTMASDGTDVQQLTEPGSFVVDNLPDWSPDGRHIVFERQFQDRPNEVHLVNADGTGEAIVDPGCPVGIPASQICEETSPEWSPDGSRIAFGWPYGQVIDGTIEVFAVGVMDPDGGNVEQLTNLERPTSAEDIQPIWSPDGSRIAFVRLNTTAAPVDGAAIFVINADGTNEQQITPWELRAADPAWSPDGVSISFRSEPVAAQEFVGDLYTVAPDGSDLRQVTDHEEGTSVLGSTFSPDSEWIAFARSGVGGLPDIYVMRRDGSDLVPLTQTPVWDSAPDWSPA